jgi:hypothetical protein
VGGGGGHAGHVLPDTQRMRRRIGAEAPEEAAAAGVCVCVYIQAYVCVCVCTERPPQRRLGGRSCRCVCVCVYRQACSEASEEAAGAGNLIPLL